MADTETDTDQTGAGDAGHTTTEWTVTKVAMFVGGLLELSIIPTVQFFAERFPNAVWLATVLGVCGVVIQIAAALGYQRARSLVKSALANTDAARLIGSGATPGAMAAYRGP